MGAIQCEGGHHGIIEDETMLRVDNVGTGEAYPCPPFEGSEKRIEIRFEPKQFGARGASNAMSMRSIPRADLDAMLVHAGCEIISSVSSAHTDAYLLSESTMFVEKSGIVLKTCGTTKLLAAVPRIIALAKSLCGLDAAYVKYSRASYLFPDAQPEIHRSWNEEVRLLKKYFSSEFGCSGTAHVMGDSITGLQWHLFTIANENADRERARAELEPTVEICMTGIGKDVAARFYQSGPTGFTDASLLSRTLGIRDLIPNENGSLRSMKIDEFIFEPCGYSMNSVNDDGSKACMHVTPEDACSFVSHEVSWNEVADLDGIIRRTIEIFQPKHVSILVTSRTVSALNKSLAWVSGLDASNDGHESNGISLQQFASGGFALMTSLHSERRLPPSSRSFGRAAQCGLERGVDCFGVGVRAARAADGMPQIASQPAAMPFHDEVPFAFEQNKPLARATDATPATALYALDPVAIEHSCPDSIDTFARYIIRDRGLDDTFYVTDLGVVRRRWEEWQFCLPRIEVHYAVKCNPDIGILSMLASLGSSFDCASVSEFEAVLGLGVHPSRIVYANPCKPPAHAKAATAAGIDLQTFDTVFELKKLSVHAPNARLLLRVRADDTSARCELGSKFGAEEHEIAALLRSAREMKSNVVGVSFHVGSGAGDPKAFPSAIAMARQVFDLAKGMGFDNMYILDIGGGFSGGGIDSGLTLREAAPIINCALDRHFPRSSGVKIIAEPGRYFAEKAATLYTKIFGRREYQHCPVGMEDSAEFRNGDALKDDDASALRYGYYISDGVYGSMNCLFYDHAVLQCRPLRVSASSSQALGGTTGDGEEDRLYNSTVFGPTCDGLDKVLEGVMLPRLEDDWLVFPSMGAYTLSAASDFNGFDATATKVFYVTSKNADSLSSNSSNSDESFGDGAMSSAENSLNSSDSEQ